MRILVLGGAGFIGAHVAAAFLRDGATVTVVDGLLARTGADRERLARAAPAARLVAEPVRTCETLPALLGDADVVVDAMGWTLHRDAIDDPLYDLELNVASHLSVIQALVGAGRPPRLIYLGSRGEYGDAPGGEAIDESAPLRPLDVQGINKAAADHHYALAAARGLAHVTSLRFSNTFGEGQPTRGDDIGLIGVLTRDLVHRGKTVVFGSSRRREVLYVDDVARAVTLLARKPSAGYRALNLPGHDLSILELAQRIAAALGEGSIEQRPLGPELAFVEQATARLRGDRLRATIGDVPLTDLDSALKRTVSWLRGEFTSTAP